MNDKIPNSVFDDMAQYAGKEYFKYLKSNWNKQQYLKGKKFVKWVKLDPQYEKWKVKNFGQLNILVLHGNLLNSFQIDYPKNGQFRIWNDSPYATSHQNGYAEKNIPKRPMLWTDNKKLVEIINKYSYSASNDLKKWVVAQFKK